jgi:hypothetical protein
MTPTPHRVGVRLAGDEWVVVLEALRRFAAEHEAVGRPDRDAVAHRALSTLATYHLRAGVGRAGRRGVDRRVRLTRATAGDEAFGIPLDLDDSFTRLVAVLHQGLSAAADAEAQSRS